MREYLESEKDKLINSYLEKYGDSYNDYQIYLIKENFGKSYKDYLTQIYHALNLYRNDENPYIGITNIIEKIFGLDINIVEVGGGVYPALSECIAKRQMRINKGTITVYDPYLSKKLDLKHINLKKEYFYGYGEEKADLVIGKEPCAATNTLINFATINKKNLVLSPCECYELLPEYYEFDNNPIAQWYEYVKDQITYQKDDNLHTYYLETKYNYNNPIYVKKKEYHK